MIDFIREILNFDFYDRTQTQEQDIKNNCKKIKSNKIRISALLTKVVLKVDHSIYLYIGQPPSSNHKGVLTNFQSQMTITISLTHNLAFYITHIVWTSIYEFF